MEEHRQESTSHPAKGQAKAEGDAKIKEAVEEIRESPGSPRDGGVPPEPDPERAGETITDEGRESPTVNDSSFPDETASEQPHKDGSN